MSATGSYDPSNVEPSTATTPIVFSSHWRDGRLGRQVVRVALHRHEAGLDLPVAAELLPAHLHVGAHHHVGPVGRLAARSLSVAPPPLQRHPGEHGGLARARRRRARRLVLVRRVPQPAQHVHAALLELGRARVLVLVDHVLVERLGHEPVGLGLHPRRDERREVEPGVAVEHELVAHELVRRVGIHLEFRDGVARRASRLARARVHRAQDQRREVLDELRCSAMGPPVLRSAVPEVPGGSPRGTGGRFLRLLSAGLPVVHRLDGRGPVSMADRDRIHHAPNETHAVPRTASPRWGESEGTVRGLRAGVRWRGSLIRRAQIAESVSEIANPIATSAPVETPSTSYASGSMVSVTIASGAPAAKPWANAPVRPLAGSSSA